MSGVRVWERLTRNAALGLRFWDAAESTSAVDGLLVEVFPRSNPRARCRAFPNRSGVYVAHAIQGLRDYEFGLDDPLAESPPRTAPYRVEVRDPSGRFLPFAFDADLPARGLFTSIAPWLSPSRAVTLLTEPGSPPGPAIEGIPLFSAPARPVPDPLGVVYAQLMEEASPSSRRPAAWCLLGVTVDGARRGLGLADEVGRVAVIFPYPEPPRRSFASPPEQHNDFTWEVELVAFWSRPSPARPAPAIPDLADVLASLDAPGTVVLSRVSPAMPLRLGYRQPLTVRTAGAADADASYLFVSA
jgi:hypothetical protein